MSSTPTTREKLDVESSQAREARLGNLLSSISSPSSDSPKGTSLPSPPNPIPNRPSAVPESDVLARARAFLPMLQASNQELLAAAAQNPDSVNIEKINGGNAIAMDLGLGVFDAPSDSKSDLGPVIDSEPPAKLAAQGQQNAEESEESDVTSSSDSSNESSEEESEEEESSASDNPDHSS